jgi:hypothetical protein
MSLAQDKYKQLTDAATAARLSNLLIDEQDGVLHISGDTTDPSVKDHLWNVYGQLDPNFQLGDVILDITTTVSSGTKATVTTNQSNLNIRKGPGTDQEIVGKAAHGETVTIMSQPNEQWWLVRTAAGEEGYAYAEFLSPQV